MICDPCRVGGELNRIGKHQRSELYHQGCYGLDNNSCFCQHRTGPDLIIGRTP